MATPAPEKRSGPGCLVALVLLPIVIVLGVVIGTVLSSDDSPDDGVRSVTLLEGDLDGVEWRVDAVRDVEGDVCAFLYEDEEAPLNGACTLSPQDVTYGDQTVVFGRASSEDETVRVVFESGEVKEIATVTVDGLDGRFYAEVVDGDLNAESLE